MAFVAAVDGLDELPAESGFDLDCYRILCRFLERPPPRARLVVLG